jgi:hypothetical protein
MEYVTVMVGRTGHLIGEYTAKSKKSNYKVKRNLRKTYDLQLDPELQAAWATDQELPEGQFKQCWPHGKYPPAHVGRDGRSNVGAEPGHFRA